MFAVMTDSHKTNEFPSLLRGCTCIGTTCESRLFSTHFLLNVLNHMSSELEINSNLYRIIELLGNSLHLIFNGAQNGDLHHTFEKEMALVKNTINIHQCIYLHDLEVIIKNENLIPNDFPIPLGLLQIPVENAIVHGLQNKEKPPYHIIISLERPEKESKKALYQITIEDNGLGRKFNFPNTHTDFNYNRNLNSTPHNSRKSWGLRYLSSIADFENIELEIIDKTPDTGTIVKLWIYEASENKKTLICENE